MAQSRSQIANLFFLRRRPHFTGSLREWETPDQEAYSTVIGEHRFITQGDIEEYAAAQKPPIPLDQFPTLLDDLKLLNGESYLHTYFKFDSAALHYQNTYYLYNWIFVVGAFATALLGFLSIVLSNSVVWVATGIIGFITTVYTFKNNREVPQREWYMNRRRAETLRSHYFQYLAQVPPYHGSNENREIRLLQTVIQVSRLGKRTQSAQPVQTSDEMPVEPRASAQLTDAEAEFLRYIYIQNRLRFQEAFYTSRMSEFRQNSSIAHTLTAILMGASTLIAGWSAISDNSIIPLLVVLLPSAAGMFVSFQQIYAWERQLTLYDETLDQLKNAQIPLIAGVERKITVPRLTDAIAACETVFATESDQWGQDVLNSNVPDRDKVMQEMFDAQLERLGLNTEQKERVYSIIQSPQNTAAARAATPDAPPTPAQPDSAVTPPGG